MGTSGQQITRTGGDRNGSFNTNVISRVSSSADVSSRNEGVSLTFPQQLMRVLSDESLNDIITWLPHGMGWKIIDRDRFSTEVLPKYFEKRSKWTSFTRKLNRWKFTRVTRGEEVGAYYHPQFQRGKNDLCAEMTCMGSRTVQNIEPLDPVALGLATPQMIQRGLLASSVGTQQRNTASPIASPPHDLPSLESSMHTSSINHISSSSLQLTHQYRLQTDGYQRYAQRQALPEESNCSQTQWMPHGSVPHGFDGEQQKTMGQQYWRPTRTPLSFPLSESTHEETPQASRQAGMLHVLSNAMAQARQMNHAHDTTQDLMIALAPSSRAGMSQDDDEQQVSPSIFDTTSSSSEADEKNAALRVPRQEGKETAFSSQNNIRSDSDSLSNAIPPPSPSGRSRSLQELQESYIAAAMMHQRDTSARDKNPWADETPRFLPPGSRS